MNLDLTSHFSWESKVDHAMKVIDVRSLSNNDYGPGLSRLRVMVICSGQKIGHKPRVRLAHATKSLSMDVILDLHYFVKATHVERRRKLCEELLGGLRQVFEKRKMKEFAFERFLGDLDCLLTEQLNGQDSMRFDQFCLERATGF